MAQKPGKTNLVHTPQKIVHSYFSKIITPRDTIFVNSISTYNNRILTTGSTDHFRNRVTSTTNSLAVAAIGHSVVIGTFTLNITTTGSTCGNSNGTISIIPSGGTAPYMFSENGYPFQAAGAFTGLAAGSYTVTVIDATGASAMATVALTNTFTPPTVSVAGYTNVTGCSTFDASVTLIGAAGTPPYKFGSDEINFQTSNIINNLSAGNYSFFVQDANGCVAPIYFPLSELCSFYFGSYASNLVCTNEGTIQFVGVGGGTAPYEYSLDGINFQTSPDFYNLTTGLHTAYIRDATGITLAYTYPMYPYCPINVAILETDANCGMNNGSLQVNASNGVGPYLYSLDGVSFQSSNIFNGLTPGNYSVTVKDFNGGIGSVNGILVNGLCPTVTAVATNSTCGNNNGSLLAAGAGGTKPYQYSLDGVNFQSSNYFAALAAGVYTVTLKDANGLLNSTGATIIATAGPLISASAVMASCANNDGSVLAVATGGTLPYLYSLDAVNFQAGNTFGTLPAGGYNVVVKDQNGCTSSKPVTVPLNNTLTLNAGLDVTICEGTTVQLGAVSSGIAFIWTPMNGVVNSTALNPKFTPNSTTTYTLTASSGICNATDNVTVFVNPAPRADAGNDSTICFGQDIQLNGSGGINYSWTPSTYLSDSKISNPVVNSPAASIIYYLNVTDGNGCTSLNNDFVNISVTPPAKVFVGHDTSIAVNQPLQLNALDLNNSGFDQYIWTPSIGLSDPYISNPIALVTNDITYTVTATAPGGCSGTGTITVKSFAGPAIYVPNAFTPNGDGHNDFLRAIPVGIAEFKYFAIFSRWGQQVFYTNDPGKGWNGCLNGVIQDTGGYVWITAGMDYNGNLIQKKGTVLLLR